MAGALLEAQEVRVAAFRDRREAGQLLARKLGQYANRDDVLVLALPRGGVPVAFEVAEALNAPLDVFPVRKLGVPGNEELAMGAVAGGGVRVLNEDVVHAFGVTEQELEAVTARELDELRRRERLYRGERSPLEVHGRTVVIVDDGLATGATMRAAVAALREMGAQEIVVAVPTAAPSSCREFEERVATVVCVITPEPFFGVGLWYQDFSQTSDGEVSELLERSARRQQRRSGEDA